MSFRIFFADEYYHACCRSNAFSFHSTFNAQKLIFVPSIVLIDIWYKSSQLIVVKNERFTRTICLYIKKFFCNWLIFAQAVALEIETNVLD